MPDTPPDNPPVWRNPDPIEFPAIQPKPPPPPPLDPSAIQSAFTNPARAVDVVLASPDRVSQNLETHTALGSLAILFLLVAAVFALPYGFVLGLDAWWRVGAFYLGSTLICLPSLFVFSAYLGFGATLSRTAVLALTIPAAAAIFTAGFAPILWFLQLTFDVEAKQITWQHVSVVLLWVSLAAGVVQLWRSLRRPAIDTALVLYVLLWIAWHGVFFFVVARMGHLLGLTR